MNKKYIKRQLTLHELGIPMDDDIQMMYDLFNELIGNLNKSLSVSSIKPIKRTYWMKNNNIILEYDINNKYFNIDANIWSELSIECNLERKDINKIISAFLEKQLNVKIIFTRSLWWTEKEARIILE